MTSYGVTLEASSWTLNIFNRSIYVFSFDFWASYLLLRRELKTNDNEITTCLNSSNISLDMFAVVLFTRLILTYWPYNKYDKIKHIKTN